MKAANGLCVLRPFSSDSYDFGTILSTAVRCTCASSHSIRMPDAALFGRPVPGWFARCFCGQLIKFETQKHRLRRQRDGAGSGAKFGQAAYEWRLRDFT